MKYSIALVPVFVAASLAGPIETRQDKKPFIEVPDVNFWINQCRNGPNLPSSEICRGTHAYCKERFYKKAGEPFGSTQDCFRSRETPAFQEPAPRREMDDLCAGWSKSWSDLWMKTSEACLGTNEYCNQKIYEKDGEPFDSPQACIDSRKAKSSANPEVSQGGDIRQKAAEFCAKNKLNLSVPECNIQVAQCTFDNKDATSFDVIAKCVESRN
ncbi:hypothetical protein MY10362_001800 [Beauveria mimosiformis]